MYYVGQSKVLFLLLKHIKGKLKSVSGFTFAIAISSICIAISISII